MRDPKQRFSSRVENYTRYRPDYPAEILDILKADCQLTPQSVVADIGSGTGILSKLFLKNGNRVFGVEPNREMREAGERLLRDYPRFFSVEGSAEESTLVDHSADFVTAGQAFHWFHPGKAHLEFKRILKPQGWVVLIWNERQVTETPFLQAYETLLQTYGTDYQATSHRHLDIGAIRSFFGHDTFKLKTLSNRQIFDLEGVKGRLLSSSYTPEAGHPNYEPMLEELEKVFEAYQVNGKVSFDYDTQIYYGQL